jgi:hypothetical protein
MYDILNRAIFMPKVHGVKMPVREDGNKGADISAAVAFIRDSEQETRIRNRNRNCMRIQTVGGASTNCVPYFREYRKKSPYVCS